MFTNVLKDTIKDTDEQPDKEIYRVRSGRILRVRVSALWSRGASPSHNVDIFTNLEDI